MYIFFCSAESSKNLDTKKRHLTMINPILVLFGMGHGRGGGGRAKGHTAAFSQVLFFCNVMQSAMMLASPLRMHACSVHKNKVTVSL